MDYTTLDEILQRNYQIFVEEQWPAAMNSEGNCVYVLDNHPGCSVGCCLDDEERRKISILGHDSEGVATLMEAGVIECSVHSAHMSVIQEWHDEILAHLESDVAKKIIEQYPGKTPQRRAFAHLLWMLREDGAEFTFAMEKV